MSPVKPFSAPQPSPAAPSRISPSVPAKTDGKAAFKPGLEASRATPRLSQLTSSPRPHSGTADSQNPPDRGANLPEGRRLFTLQALSAYAGTVIDADDATAGTGVDVPSRPERTPDRQRPVPPGSRLDLKI